MSTPSDNRQELLTREQLAERLSVAPSTISKWAAEGRISKLKLSFKVARYEWPLVLDELKASVPDYEKWIELKRRPGNRAPSQ